MCQDTSSLLGVQNQFQSLMLFTEERNATPGILMANLLINRITLITFLIMVNVSGIK